MAQKHHTIDFEGLQEWLSDQTVTYASSTRENKRLVCNLKGGITVMVGNEIKWQGIQPYLAAEAYNSITEKWINPLKDFKI